jgi:2-phosphoglycerate kinase
MSYTDMQLRAGIVAMRDELAEARRYVRTKPTEAHAAIHRFMNKLQDHRGRHRTITDNAFRWACNLTEGMHADRAVPNVLEGAIDLTSWELFIVQGNIEKALALTDPAEPKP